MPARVLLAFSAATAFHVLPAAAHEHGDQMPWGIAGDPQAPARTVRITAADAMRFEPARLTVHEGDTVRFEVRNMGRLPHELVIGTKKELEEHAALMRKFPGMEHAEPFMAHVAPGATGTLVWKFNRAGRFPFACLVPGHYEAGMRGEIEVVARQHPRR